MYSVGAGCVRVGGMGGSFLAKKKHPSDRSTSCVKVGAKYFATQYWGSVGKSGISERGGDSDQTKSRDWGGEVHPVWEFKGLRMGVGRGSSGRFLWVLGDWGLSKAVNYDWPHLKGAGCSIGTDGL